MATHSDVTEYASSVCHPTHAECITSPSNLMPWYERQSWGLAAKMSVWDAVAITATLSWSTAETACITVWCKHRRAVLVLFSTSGKLDQSHWQWTFWHMSLEWHLTLVLTVTDSRDDQNFVNKVCLCKLCVYNLHTANVYRCYIPHTNDISSMVVSATCLCYGTFSFSCPHFYKKLCCCRKRPWDASCLSVVSFNSTIPRVQSFIFSFFNFRYSNAYN